MDSSEYNKEDHQVVVEMITTTTTTPIITSTTNETFSEVEEETSSLHDEISPLLANEPIHKPKINIFSLPYSRRKSPRDGIKKVVEVEVSIFSQFILWVWNGSKYSGYVCMAMSASIYCLMHILSDSLSVRSIPLFETIFTRCTIILISSFVWLKRTGQPVYGPPHLKSMLVLRSLMGSLSLFSFVYSVQSLPLSQAIVLNFTTPIMASIAARIFLQEKLKLADVGGLACSFFGLLFIFRPMLITQGGLVEIGEARATYFSKINHPVYAVCAGLFSAITGGISYCFIQAGAKASDQPVVTVFSFANLASPAAAICMYGFQDFVVPDMYSFLLMIVLGVLSFFAEVLLARGLQLQKISRVANIQYIEVVLLQMWSISLVRATLSFGRLAGCLLILLSVSVTMYFGHEKEME
ncbi:Nodulin MtN21 /EamA-like transporter family protein [Thalictrum thalictroides]|uniref:Nodulin MtN21 /EamA-like transporter family protein n=1 Tax=Thalictrum thalictroides TaxID=46969 RepID=A0A7J6V8S8_THATH|nr:Nodulin MtN21 /EamA-like transporter family protein [Thalictrum thalictroides]